MSRAPAPRALALLLPLASIAALVSFLAVALLRIRYPFQLEWMEGCVLQVVQRVLDGKELFVAPSLEYVPVIYAPLYYYVSAASAAVFGPELFALRLVSLLSTLGVFALLFVQVRQLAGSARAGLLAVGLFAAAYRMGGAWFDVARNDMLFLLLTLAGLTMLGRARRAPTMVVAGVLLALAYLCKQTTLFVVTPVLLGCALGDWRRLLWVGLPALTLAGGACWLADRASEGWSTYYTFTLPSQHGIDGRLLKTFLVDDLLRQVPILMALAALGLAGLWRCLPWRAAGFHLCVAAGLLGGAFASRLHVGGYDNVLLPGLLALSAYAALGLVRLEQRWSSAAHRAPGRCAALTLVGLVQFAMLAYDPREQIPSAADEAAGQQLVQRLERSDGPVFAPGHGYLVDRAGHQGGAHEMAIRDIFKGRSTEVQLPLRKQLRGAVKAGVFDLIVLDDDSPFGWVGEHYEAAGPVFDQPAVFWPVTGKRSRPSTLYRRPR